MQSILQLASTENFKRHKPSSMSPFNAVLKTWPIEQSRSKCSGKATVKTRLWRRIELYLRKSMVEANNLEWASIRLGLKSKNSRIKSNKFASKTLSEAWSMKMERSWELTRKTASKVKSTSSNITIRENTTSWKIWKWKLKGSRICSKDVELECKRTLSSGSLLWLNINNKESDLLIIRHHQFQIMSSKSLSKDLNSNRSYNNSSSNSSP